MRGKKVEIEVEAGIALTLTLELGIDTSVAVRVFVCVHGRAKAKVAHGARRYAWMLLASMNSAMMGAMFSFSHVSLL